MTTDQSVGYVTLDSIQGKNATPATQMCINDLTIDQLTALWAKKMNRREKK